MLLRDAGSIHFQRSLGITAAWRWPLIKETDANIVPGAQFDTTAFERVVHVTRNPLALRLARIAQLCHSIVIRRLEEIVQIKVNLVVTEWIRHCTQKAINFVSSEGGYAQLGETRWSMWLPRTADGDLL